MFILQVSFQRQSNGLKGRKACWSNHTISKYSPWFIICSALRDLQCLIISNYNNNGYYFSCSIYTLYWHLHDKKKKKKKKDLNWKISGLQKNPLVFFYSHLHHLLHCLLCLLLQHLLCVLLLLHCRHLHHHLLHLYIFMGEGMCTGISQNKSHWLLYNILKNCVVVQDSLFYLCFWRNFPSLRIQAIEQGRGEKISLSHFVLNL